MQTTVFAQNELTLKDRYLKSLSPSIGLSYMTLRDWEIPSEYSFTPVHPKDHGETRKVVPSKKHAWGNLDLGLSVSPIPYPYFDILRIGYKIRLPFESSNEYRTGNSNMEWYEYGSYAGTYVKWEVPSYLQSVEVGLRIPSPAQKNNSKTTPFAEVGMSYDMSRFRIQSGWDRHYSEQKRYDHLIKSNTWNPYFRMGVAWEGKNSDIMGSCSFYVKGERVEGKSPFGDVSAHGHSIGIQLALNY